MTKIKVAVVCFAIVFSAAALAWWCGEDPAQEMAVHRISAHRRIADEFQSFEEPLGQQGDDGHQTHTGGDATRNCFVVLPKAAAQIVKTATVAIGDYPEKGDAFMGICEVIER